MTLAQSWAGAHPGFLLMEVLLGIVVFSLFVSAVGYTLLYGQESTIMAGDRMRAVQFTEKALEATRAIRDASFSSLSAGQHGVYTDASGKWAFTGSTITSSGGYITHVTVSSMASDWVRLSAETKWKRGYNRSGSVLITTDLTDWRSTKTAGNWNNFTQEGIYTSAGTPLFNNIALYDDYLFVTSETSDGGDGLYVFDISSLTAPTRIATSFDLNVAGYDAVVRGQRLYVLTAGSSTELRIYDIADPANFSASDLVTSYDLPGSGRGRSLAVRGNTLLLGATESSTSGQDELYAFDISNSGALVLQDSLNATAGINAIAVTGTSALLATTDNAQELKVAKVDDPANISFPSGEAYNATDTQDGQAIAVTGTAAVLGRASGESIDELLLLDMEGGGGFPSPPPGPWYHEVGGSVNELAVDPGGCYAFLATDMSTKEMQVVQIHSTLLPESDYYDVSSGAGRGMFYDVQRDRAYMVTNSALHIFKPGTGSNSCS